MAGRIRAFVLENNLLILEKEVAQWSGMHVCDSVSPAVACEKNGNNRVSQAVCWSSTGCLVLWICRYCQRGVDPDCLAIGVLNHVLKVDRVLQWAAYGAALFKTAGPAYPWCP